jgi:hypothetical protein
MGNIQTQPTLMERFLEQMLANQTRQLEQSEKYSGLAEKTAAQQSEWMEMLMAEHRKKQSANPFIALLDGYIGMKKRKNPEYEWRGLATTVPEAIGGLLGRSRQEKSLPYTPAEMPSVGFERSNVRNPIYDRRVMVRGGK